MTTQPLPNASDVTSPTRVGEDEERCAWCAHAMRAGAPLASRCEAPDERGDAFSERFCSADCYHAYGRACVHLVRPAGWGALRSDARSAFAAA